MSWSNEITSKQNLIEIGKYVMDKNLAWGNSGNMSARVDHDSMVMTASGTYMGELTEEDIVKVNIATGHWEGEKKPSKEIPMHKAIYTVRDEANVVLHSSPFWSTLLACSDVPLYSNLFIESMYYLKDIEYVDYFHPGSDQLGEAVGEKAQKSNVIILKNHGVIVFDDSFKEAKMRLETLELTCKMIITAMSAKVNFDSLNQETVTDFLQNSGYKPKAKMKQRD